MINILIADDHELIREGLKKILKKEPDMQVLGEARNAQETFEQVKDRKLNIVLLDISMPGLSGLDVLTELRQNYPKLPILILSMHPEDRFAVRALRAGAAGYVTKDSAVGELVQAIRKVVTGAKYVSIRLAEKLAEQVEKGDEKLPHEKLSDREFQIMRMIAEGKKISEIAEELTLSISTVNTYRTRILKKMFMETNVDITRYAIENHLIE
jgi:two-component system, NarL family, invasion response regulator UvrY